MIALERRRDDSIPPVFIGEGRRKKERKVLKDERSFRAGEKEKRSFDKDVWKKAKPRLIEETHGKCAYCEASFAMVAYGDVEHFRPKSKYWWLAYCFDNYLASCQICNQAHKRDQFPVLGERLTEPALDGGETEAALESWVDGLGPDPLDGGSVEEYLADHRRERPALLDPYVDDPETYFAWEADDVAKEVLLVSLPESEHESAIVARVVQAANDIYGLDRPALRTERYTVYRQFRTLKRVEQEPDLSNETRAEVRALIEHMKSSEGKFAGMVRYFDRAL